MGFTRREELRGTFEGVGPLYHRARPSYPEQIFTDLAEITGLAPPDRLLEIGSGTGIATVVLAEKGFPIVCVEPDESMVATARRNLVNYPSVVVFDSSFEDFDPGAERFAAVVAFSAFHWIEPNVRHAKVAEVLRERGFHIVADARVIAPDDADPFFADVEEDYQAVLGDSANAPGAPCLASLGAEMSGTGLFRHLAERRYRWDVDHTADAYLDLLSTIPWIRAIDEVNRVDLLERIGARIERAPQSQITVTFEAVLDVAARI